MKNQAHSEHFRIYEDSKTRARIVGELQGREITMSRLHDWLVTALNENNVTAGAALTHPAFSLIDRQRLKHWQRLFHEQLSLADACSCRRKRSRAMKADEALEQAVVAWRTKHQIREDDPMLAALDLVRVYLAHAPLPARDAAEVPPTYAEFRETVELLDRRANSFGKQSLDLIVELRKVAERGAGKRELSLPRCS